MDQIKQFLAVAKKHHFWILSGVALLMGLGGWFYATSQINADKAKEIAEIKSKEQAARSIGSEQNHPNRQYVEGMDRFVSLYRADVEQAWQRKWDAQQKDLAWPAELNVTGTDFTDAIDGLLRGRPIEAVPDEDLRLAVRLRERYRDYIKEELPKLAERIGAKWAPQGGGNRGGVGGYGGGGSEGYGGYEEAPSYTGGMEYEGLGGVGRGRGPLREKPPLVVWNPSNQGAIQADSFDWTSRDNNTPTTKEVLYAQENLWVLENLMDIIARTNGAITEPHQATIKRIDSIEFGREVLPISSKVARVRKATAGTGTEGMESMDYATESEGMDPSMASGEMGLEGGAVDPSLLDPAHRRYVDKDYKKLTADELKSAMASPSAEQYYLAVAKRLPVRMKLQMDQRKLDKLLVECGNANLMVEVRQVRVAGKATAQGAGGGYGGGGEYGGGGGYDTGGGYEDEAGGGSEMYGGGRGARGKTDADEKIFEVPVEIYGIIYIYNPANKELLGVEEGDLSGEEGLEENLAETASRPATQR